METKKAEELEADQSYYVQGLNWMNSAFRLDYPYMYEWLGVPVIQFPGDLLLLQEAIVASKTNKVIEVGIARGGTTIFLASILELLGRLGKPNVIGVDISISKHTLDAINNSKFKESIELIEGDSIETSTFQRLSRLFKPKDRVMVILDSNHSMDHVYREIQMYSEIVSSGSYLIVMDTAIEYLDPDIIPKGKPWGRGNSPDTAVKKFLREKPEVFSLDRKLDNRSFPGASKGGFLLKH